MIHYQRAILILIGYPEYSLRFKRRTERVLQDVHKHMVPLILRMKGNAYVTKVKM